MKHLLVDCNAIRMLWENLKKWIKYFLKVDIELTPELILLNNYSRKYKSLINTMIIIMKQYVYSTKCMAGSVTFMEFVGKIYKWHNIEKQAAYENNHVKAYKKKWRVYIEG